MNYCRLEDLRDWDGFSTEGRRMLEEHFESAEWKDWCDRLWSKHKYPNACEGELYLGEACR